MPNRPDAAWLAFDARFAGVSPRMRQAALRAARVRFTSFFPSVDQVRELSDAELLQTYGVGEAGLRQLRRWLAEHPSAATRRAWAVGPPLPDWVTEE